MSNTDVGEERITPPKKVTRDEIRSKVFSAESMTPKKKTIDFFGSQIEIHQPLMGEILKLRSEDEEERRSAVLDTLVSYSYVPGTNERVFDDTDVESFKNMPWGPDFTKVMEAFGELTGINFQGRKGDSKETE